MVNGQWLKLIIEKNSMTPIHKYLAILMALSFLALGCKNENENCIKGRVIKINCAGYVIQVFNRDSVGDYGWKDIRAHTVYNNVFGVKNSCKIGNWYRGEAIYFSIKDTASDADCVACKVYDAPPRKAYQIENV